MYLFIYLFIYVLTYLLLVLQKVGPLFWSVDMYKLFLWVCAHSDLTASNSEKGTVIAEGGTWILIKGSAWEVYLIVYNCGLSFFFMCWKF